jgi:hypothetical protein
MPVQHRPGLSWYPKSAKSLSHEVSSTLIALADEVIV